jgi:hypothetical protein
VSLLFIAVHANARDALVMVKYVHITVQMAISVVLQGYMGAGSSTAQHSGVDAAVVDCMLHIAE